MSLTLATGDDFARLKTLADLSPRQRQLAKLVAAGLPNKAIALEMRLTSKTVATYITRVLRKLGLDHSNRTALASWVHEQCQGCSPRCNECGQTREEETLG